MKSEEIRNTFLEFFKTRGHAIVPSSSLVPENDPTVLFTTAGMQPLVPYLMGEPHPAGRRIANVQKCVRTGDIDEIGDATHLTFFEMLGNWSLGDYFKENAIQWSYELLTSKEGFGLDPSRLYVTIFAGDEHVPVDEEARQFWIKAGIPEHRIYELGADANWWPNVKGPSTDSTSSLQASSGQVKDTWTGPTGPSTEMFYDLTPEGLGDMTHDEFVKADDDQKVVEIWNDVFMSYEKKDGEIVGELQSKNVDTGAGLERIATVLQGKNTIFETDLFEPIMAAIPAGNETSRRIIADHIRTAVFMISDGVTPSNTDRGYVLRRLIRRAVRHADKLGVELTKVIETVIEKYSTIYRTIDDLKDQIKNEISAEENKFKETLKKGLKEFEKISGNDISGQDAFKLFSTYGFPLELTQELAQEKGVSVAADDFNQAFKVHQEQSREGAEKKFKGGLGDTSEMSLRYHTATHLLHQALRDVLGDHVEQKGSNITPERLRFDFSHDMKMTDEEKQQVEEIVNEKIQAALPVNKAVLPFAEAEKTGALHFFGEKYGDEVSVYYVGDSLETAYSKEFCGGPHVSNTSELGSFKIKKEEASSAGVRRIKAILG